MPSATRLVEKKSAPEADDPIHRLLCGRVRELRKKKGWTLDELSAACGVSRSMLSEIERGKANPTLAVAFRIAGAFSMSLGDLVDVPAATRKIDVIRADDRAYRGRPVQRFQQLRRSRFGRAGDGAADAVPRSR